MSASGPSDSAQDEPIDIDEALRRAEAVLPGEDPDAGVEDDGTVDPRSVTVFKLWEYAKEHPAAIWAFTERWAVHERKDVRDLLTWCIDGLLSSHYDEYAPRIEALARSSSDFADTLFACLFLRMGPDELALPLRRLLHERGYSFGAVDRRST